MSQSRWIRKWTDASVGPTLGAVAVTLMSGFAFGQLNQQPDTGQWATADGTVFNPFLAKRQPSVLLFLMTDCPIANKFAPELGRIIKRYEAKGVRFTVVYVDANLNREAAKRHAREYGLDCTIALDPTHSLAKRAGATVSPEAVVIGANGSIVYRGRIDDRVADYGKIRPEPRQRDLRLTLDSMLLGKLVKVSRTKAVGCIFRKDEP